MKRFFQMMGCMAAICLLLSSCSTKATSDKVLRHVVMFGFNDNLTEQQVQEIEEAFCALPSQIEEVKGFEWGTDCSPEGLQQGQTHCFFLTFHSDKDRDTYLVHPAHKAFGKLINGKVKAVTVLDYWTK